MNDKDISRRVFIQRLSLFGASGALLAACGGGEQQSDTPAETMETPAETGMADESFSCTDTSGLTEPEIAMRNQLQYVDESPEEGKTCANCALYQPAAEGQCGACTVVKGPIHPNGYCTSWAQKPA